MMPPTHNPSAALSTERVLAASPQAVFAAFARPDLLAQWWGPSGFTSTFERFEFTAGGRWVFVLHGPDGTDYPNESVFLAIQPDQKIVLEHVVGHWFILTVTLTARGDGTHLTWVQEFRSPDVAEKLRSVVVPANEQNLDRLQAVLASDAA
ncbi:MAG: SRPBCC domain-containing protein [Gemmatimonadaceae bacterium]|nr:SRPBCC domain-containing protein [Gemmatimonadaceae bacterium]